MHLCVIRAHWSSMLYLALNLCFPCEISFKLLDAYITMWKNVQEYCKQDFILYFRSSYTKKINQMDLSELHKDLFVNFRLIRLISVHFFEHMSYTFENNIWLSRALTILCTICRVKLSKLSSGIISQSL